MTADEMRELIREENLKEIHESYFRRLYAAPVTHDWSLGMLSAICVIVFVAVGVPWILSLACGHLQC